MVKTSYNYQLLFCFVITQESIAPLICSVAMSLYDITALNVVLGVNDRQAPMQTRQVHGNLSPECSLHTTHSQGPKAAMQSSQVPLYATDVQHKLLCTLNAILLERTTFSLKWTVLITFPGDPATARLCSVEYWRHMTGRQE